MRTLNHQPNGLLAPVMRCASPRCRSFPRPIAPAPLSNTWLQHLLNILLHSCDPYWADDHEGESVLPYVRFFQETLLNLQHLDFRASWIEEDRYMISIPDSSFTKDLPRLKKLRYLWDTDGPIRTSKNLASREFGFSLGSAGPAIVYPDELRVFFNGNKTSSC